MNPSPSAARAPDTSAHTLPLLPVLGAVTRTQWAAVLALSLLVFAGNAPMLVELARARGAPLGAGGLLFLVGLDYAFWSLVLWPVFWIFDRTPLRRGARVAHGFARGVTGIATVSLYAVVVAVARGALAAQGARDPRGGVAAVLELMPGGSLGWQLPFNAITLFLVLAAAHAILQRIHRTQRTLRWAADLRVTAVTAQLQAMALELQPHFLFNTLNGVAELMHEDPRRAERLLLTLGRMLRETVETRRAPLIPLRAELDQLGRYVALQEMRFGARLRVRWDVDERALTAEVPTMLLQPLVENAITHGLQPRRGGGTLTIEARCERGADGDQLRLTVADDGVGLRDAGPAPPRVGGVGLPNTRERLHALFGDAAGLSLGPEPSGGTRAVVVLPCRSAAGAPGETSQDPWTPPRNGGTSPTPDAHPNPAVCPSVTPAPTGGRGGARATPHDRRTDPGPHDT